MKQLPLEKKRKTLKIYRYDCKEIGNKGKRVQEEGRCWERRREDDDCSGFPRLNNEG